MHCWTYDGNLNALYSVNELEYFVDRTKHKVSPSYSPTVARECLHIKCTVGLHDVNPNALITRSRHRVSNMSRRGLTSARKTSLMIDNRPARHL